MKIVCDCFCIQEKKDYKDHKGPKVIKANEVHFCSIFLWSNYLWSTFQSSTIPITIWIFNIELYSVRFSFIFGLFMRWPANSWIAVFQFKSTLWRCKGLTGPRGMHVNKIYVFKLQMLIQWIITILQSLLIPLNKIVNAILIGVLGRSGRAGLNGSAYFSLNPSIFENHPDSHRSYYHKRILYFNFYE